MKYYKYIDLPGWEEVASSVLDYVETQTNFLETNYFWNYFDPIQDQEPLALLSTLFASIGFDLKKVAVLVVTQDIVPIHQDTVTYPFGRINIPLKNCQGTKTVFYQATKWDPQVLAMANGVEYIYHKEENCLAVDSVEIIKPTALRVQELHNVITTNCIKPRITLTCFTEPDAKILLEE